MSSTLLTPNCDRKEQATERAARSAIGDYSRTFLLCKQLFLGWIKLRNVGEVSQLKYSSDHAPLATPATLIRKPGPTLKCPFIPMAVCLSRKECVQRMCEREYGTSTNALTKHVCATSGRSKG